MAASEPEKLIRYLGGADRATSLFLVQLRVVSYNKIKIFMDPQEVEKFINALDKQRKEQQKIH